jgi:hypothetical protein
MTYKSRTPQEWLQTIKINPWKLCLIPKNMITTEILREAVQLDGEVLEVIHVRNLDYMVQNDIYELAVQNKGSSIEFVPEDCITDRLCHNAINGSQGNGENLKFIPKKLRSNDLCKEAVNQNISNILHVPSEKITHEMFIIVIHDNINLFNHINLDNMHPMIAKRAIQKGFDFNKLPKHLQTKEILEGVDYDIKNLPKEFLTKEMCMKALEKSGEAFEYIPKEFIDTEMVQILLKHEGKIKFTKE